MSEAVCAQKAHVLIVKKELSDPASYEGKRHCCSQESTKKIAFMMRNPYKRQG